MHRSAKFSPLVLTLLSTALAVLACEARGQFRNPAAVGVAQGALGARNLTGPGSQPVIGPSRQTTVSAAIAAGFRSGYAARGLVTPYGVYTPYGTIEDPLAGFMRGTADIISAEGEFRIKNQQSKLIREEVERSKIDTRRKKQEQWLWERDNLPTHSEEEERMRAERVRQTLADPPLTQIWSGATLNTMLTELRIMHDRYGRGPSVPLDPAVLQEINVTTGTGGSGLGLLKSGPTLNWPVELQGDAYKKDRDNLEQLIPQAMREAQAGRVQAATVRDIEACLNGLLDTLKERIEEMTPTDNIQSKRYINQLKESLKSLQDPKAQNYLNRTYAAHGNTVSELVDYMNSNGLIFAPATEGDQAAYTSLHRSMVTYHNQLTRMVSLPPRTSPGMKQP